MAASAVPEKPGISTNMTSYQFGTDAQYIQDPPELLMHVDPPSESKNTAK